MILDQFKLTGKVAIVTGAGRGLGQGMALALAEAGADIVGVDILETTETENAVNALGRRFFGIKANLMNSKICASVISKAAKKMRKVDILVNCAGIIRRSDITEFSEKDWDDVMNLNAKSLFFLSQATALQFIAQKSGGKIINIASMLSYQGGIRVVSYTASKHSVVGITRAMANELAGHNIQVNAIAPGYMATDNTTALRADKKRYKQILERIPAGRWGTPDDLKGTVTFLASPASDYITGSVIPVDGGWLAR